MLGARSSLLVISHHVLLSLTYHSMMPDTTLNKVEFGATSSSSESSKKPPFYAGVPESIIATPDSKNPMLEPFRQAVAHGADGVELDVRPTGAERKKGMKAHPRFDQKGLHSDTFTYFDKPMLSLAQVIKSLPPEANIYIEVKSKKVFFASPKKQLEKAVVEFIQNNKLHDRVRVISFSPFILRAIEKMDANIKTGLGTTYSRHNNTNPKLIDRTHRRGDPIYTWVSGQRYDIEQDFFSDFYDWGIDGFITNQPAVVVTLHQDKLTLSLRGNRS